MTKRRRLGVLLIALGTIAIGIALTSSPVGAQAPDQTGWWFELQTKTLPVPLPAPPTVPAGGLYVQQGPQGPVAYGALRYEVASAESATLTLAAAQGSTTSLGAPVRACTTTTSWSAPPASPGAWDDAPKYGDSCTLGAISSDGKYVAFFFGSEFFRSGALDVAIVPQAGASAFALAFDKPADDSLAVKVASGGLPRPTLPTTVPPAPAPAISGSPAIPHTASAAKVTATPAVAAPAVDTRPALATDVLNAAGLGDPDRGERALALGGVSLIVVGWWLLSTRAVPMPRLLGALAGAPAAADDTRVGGVGRFARARTSNPHLLR